jgi:hypothetical protein
MGSMGTKGPKRKHMGSMGTKGPKGKTTLGWMDGQMEGVRREKRQKREAARKGGLKR